MTIKYRVSARGRSGRTLDYGLGLVLVIIIRIIITTTTIFIVPPS